MSAPRFKIGESVTVRRGTRDPDFPDIPLGGWTGTVRELGAQPDAHYLIVWNDYTLANMHPVYRQRCLRDDLETESMWLREGDLEPMPTMQPALEQPTALTPRPLRLDNPADRIRAALGLSSDDPLPAVDVPTLRRYQAHLTERLTFPIHAEFVDDEAGFGIPPLPVEIVRLWPAEELDPTQGIQAEVREGKQIFLVPLADLVVRGDARAMVLIQDYAAWYEDWVEQQGGTLDDENAAVGRASIHVIVLLVLYGAGSGASIGAALATVPWALTFLLGGAFLGGAFLGGALGYLFRAIAYLFGVKFGGVFNLTTSTISRSMTGTLTATLTGVALGGVVGVLMAAILGTLFGSIALILLGRLLNQFRMSLLASWMWALVGTFLGVLIEALIRDREAATSGALLGACIGGGGVLLLLVGFLILAAFLGRDEEPME